MLLEHANATEVTAISRVRGMHDARERYGLVSVTGEPPHPAAELRNGRTMEERQVVKVGKCLRDLVIIGVDFADFVHDVQCSPLS